MTIDEFLDLLRQTPRDWFLNDCGKIRRNALGGRYPFRCCPLTACDPKSPMPVDLWAQSATALGLCHADATRVSIAADGDFEYDPALRAKLLEACGLEESNA